MPCHPDRVRLQYDSGWWSNAPAWRSLVENDAEQLRRRAAEPLTEANCQDCPDNSECDGGPFCGCPCHDGRAPPPTQDVGITANVIEGDPLEPDDDHLWGV